MTRPRRLQVEAPSFIAGTDLQDRLRALDPRIETGENGASEVIVERASDLEVALRAIQGWVEDWSLQEVEVELNRSVYRLQSQGLGWIEASDADFDLGIDVETHQ